VNDTLDLDTNGVKLPDTWKDKLASGLSNDGKTVKVLHLDPTGYSEGAASYFSLNALTIENDQPATKDGQGLNLPELVDKKWMEYVDARTEKGESRYDYPHPGGAW